MNLFTQPFSISDAWNGTSERLGKKRSYFDTLSLPDAKSREEKATKQDRIILASLQALGQATASELHKYLSEAFLKSSIRRSLTGWKDKGVARKGGLKVGPHGSPETLWIYVE